MYLNAYEVSFPLEENAEQPPAFQLNHGQQMMDGASVDDVQLSWFSGFPFDSLRLSVLLQTLGCRSPFTLSTAPSSWSPT